MKSRGLLAGVALAALWAAPAAADIVRLDITGQYWGIDGPEGWYHDPLPPCSSFASPCGQTTNGRTFVSFPVGGLPWSASLTFDTALGTLTTSANSQSLAWQSGQGPDPILSGSFTWPYPNIVRDLSQPTNVTLSRQINGLVLSIVGADYSFSFPAPARLIPGPLTLTDTYTVACGCDLSGGYIGDGFNTTAQTIFTYSFTNLGPSVPEPGAWVLAIGGFALAGGMLRRGRAALA